MFGRLAHVWELMDRLPDSSSSRCGSGKGSSQVELDKLVAR